MKVFSYLATIATTVITVLAPNLVRAQGVFVQPFPASGYSSTTIYVPSVAPILIVPTDRSIQNIYPNSNYFPNSTTTYYDSGDRIYRDPQYRQYRQYRQPPLIFRQQEIYPRSIQSACTTTIIGSPIPSPIALDRYTGLPCN